eukprot:scaffold2036_cov256-Pinguiococcus_pyrenoidosus.AAC.2
MGSSISSFRRSFDKGFWDWPALRPSPRPRLPNPNESLSPNVIVAVVIVVKPRWNRAAICAWRAAPPPTPPPRPISTRSWGGGGAIRLIRVSYATRSVIVSALQAWLIVALAAPARIPPHWETVGDRRRPPRLPAWSLGIAPSPWPPAPSGTRSNCSARRAPPRTPQALTESSFPVLASSRALPRPRSTCACIWSMSRNAAESGHSRSAGSGSASVAGAPAGSTTISAERMDFHPLPAPALPPHGC